MSETGLKYSQFEALKPKIPKYQKTSKNHNSTKKNEL